MRLSRTHFVVVLASFSTLSQASYELLLAVDNTSHLVHRFDPVSGLSLGSFGSGYLSGPAKIALDTASGIAYITDYTLGAVQKWNYNTGAYLGDLTTSVTSVWGIARLNNGNIAVADGNNVRTFNPAGTQVGSFVAGGYGLGTDGTNLFVGGFGGITKYSSAGTALGGISAPSRNPLEIQVRGGIAYAYGQSYGNKFGQFNPATMTGYSEKTVSTLATFMDIEGFALSHGTYAYTAGQSINSGTPTIFARYNLATGGAVSSFGNFASGTRITGMAIVLAPEPGTLAILALGLAALVRKRSR